MSSNITMVGRLTAPPELRFAKTGTPWATFSIAVTRGRDDDKETSFFDCKCFGALAENISEIPKGTRVISDGYLVQEKWETKDGQKRSKAVFMVNDAGPSIRFEPIVSDGPAAKRTDKQAVETVQEAFDTEPPEEEPF